MHVTIEAVCRRGLRIIDEIPNIGLCKIEGYNGVGKTSAIRLLQLCTGQQPFESNAFAWKTFRSQLVQARVRIRGLRAANEIEWLIEPTATWPEEPEDLGSKIGTTTIDGKRAGPSAVAALIRIHHLNTTETPVRILAEQARFAADAIERWYSEEGLERWQDVDRTLAKARRLLAETPLAQARLAQEVATQEKSAAADVASRTSSLRHHTELLTKAVEVAGQLDTLRGTGPQVALQLQESEQALVALDARKANLDKVITQAQIRRRLNEKAQATLDRAQNLVARRRRTLERVREELSEAAAIANIRPSHKAIAATRTSVEATLADLVESQPRVSEAPHLLVVLTGLQQKLDDAIAMDLANSVLLEAKADHPAWTVQTLRDAVQRQIDLITARTRDSGAVSLTRQIGDARNKLDAIVAVGELLRNVERSEALVNEAEAALLEAAAGADASSTERLDQLLSEQNAHEREGRELHSRIDRLRNELSLLSGGKTEEALAAEFDALCREAATEPARARSALEHAQAQLRELNQEELRAIVSANSAEKQSENLMSSVESVVRILKEDVEFDWLRRAEPRIRSLRTEDLGFTFAVVEELKVRLTAAADLLEKTVGSAHGIGSSLHELGDRLSGNTGAKQDQIWTGPVNLWLGNQARRWLDDQIMRDALFSGGMNIKLDTNSLSVSWEVQDEPFTRPLAAFSSGEQTFAFTRARVAQLDETADQVPNRLIALDEFGAALDRRRFIDLVYYLKDRQERLPSDQVLVILPLGAASQDGLDRPVIERRRADLERRGYFAEELRV